MKHNMIVIGIAGASASGKTLLANTIVEEIGSNKVVVIPQDCYYKDQRDVPFEQRVKTNYDHPNAFDFSLMNDHLNALRRGESISMPVYDFTQHCRSNETVTVGKTSIVVLEGILLFADPELRESMDIRLFVDTPLDICLIRRMKRDMELRGRTLPSILEQYLETVRPMYLQFIEPAKRYAHMIIPEGGQNRIAIDMVQAKIRELLSDT